MKRLVKISVLFLLSIGILSACSDDNEQSNNDNNSTEVEESNEEESTTEGDSESSDDESDAESTEDDDVSAGSTSSSGAADQLELTIGDTGEIDSESFTTYEVTLNDAEILDEIDGESSLQDKFIVLDITVKNTGDTTESAQDFLYSLEVTDDLDMTGSRDYSEEFDSIDGLTGEIKPGEEMSGQWVTEIYNADTYYFRLLHTSTSNEVIWTIPAEEAE